MADGTITAPAYHDGLAKKTSLTGSERIIISDNASDKTTTTAVMRDFAANAVTDTFNQKIKDEAAAREAGDKTLRTDIDANYKLLATVIDTTIPKEVAERKAADSALTSALATETAAREGGDKTLRTDLDANYKLLAGVIDTTIPNEVKERKAADAALTYRIDNCDTLILDIKKGFCDMGEFETEAKALSALGDLTYCSSNAYCVLHAHYSKEGKECNMVCIQSFNEDAVNDKHLVRQFLFNRDKVWQRCIYFTDKTRTEIKGRDDWEATFCDRLHWDADSRKLVPSLFGYTFNKDYTDAIPLSTVTSDGLMSAAQAAKLAALEQRVAALEAKA